MTWSSRDGSVCANLYAHSSHIQTPLPILTFTRTQQIRYFVQTLLFSYTSPLSSKVVLLLPLTLLSVDATLFWLPLLLRLRAPVWHQLKVHLLRTRHYLLRLRRHRPLHNRRVQRLLVNSLRKRYSLGKLLAPAALYLQIRIWRSLQRL